MNDDQLNKILAQSRPPAPSSALDERVMSSYRKITGRGMWLAVFRARVSVPVPLAVLFAGLFLVTVFWRFPRPVMPLPRISVSMPIPAPVTVIAGCPEPSQPVMHVRRPGVSGARPQSLANLAWTPVRRPEWRIEQ
jgi:hypothetical protein